MGSSQQQQAEFCGVIIAVIGWMYGWVGNWIFCSFSQSLVSNYVTLDVLNQSDKNFIQNVHCQP